jgi:hypothetical protein
MPFPEKFRSLIELSEKRLIVPDFLWLSYAVCAVQEDSCGWQGWILESVEKGDMESKGTQVSADTEQRCPVCNLPLYRTGVEKQFVLNPNARPKLAFSYDVVPPQFE